MDVTDLEGYRQLLLVKRREFLRYITFGLFAAPLETSRVAGRPRSLSQGAVPKTADAVIIGGGVNGCSIAFHLARLGVQHVVILEKDDLASGQTGRSTAIIRQHYTNPETVRLAKESLRFFERFQEDVGYSAGFVKTGFLVLVGPDNVLALKSAIEMQRALGVRTEFVEAKALRELQPSLSLEGLAGAAYEPDSGYADPHQTTQAFARAAEKRGAKILTNTPATAIRVEKGRVASIETPRGRISTRVAVNVTGAWGKRLIEPLGVEFPLEAVRAQIGLFRAPDGFREPLLTSVDFLRGIYLRPEIGGFVVGLVDETKQPRVDPESFGGAPDLALLDQFQRAAGFRYPPLASSVSLGGWACAYDVTPDWHPVLDRASDIQGLHIALGFSGHGFKLAPLTGKLMAELVTEGKCRDFDIGFFRLRRFQEGKLIRGKYQYSILG